MKIFSVRLACSALSSVWDVLRRPLFVIATVAALCSTLAVTSTPTHAHTPVYTCVAGPHSGNINENQDWCPESNPHIISGSVTIMLNATVNILPGVEVRVDAAQGMLVYGTLNAEGTSGSKILFTSSAASPAAGDWVGLQVWNGSTVHMDYVDLAYAGRDGNRAIYVQAGSDFQINHSRIHHNQGYGVVLEGSGLTGQLQNLEMDHNTQYPIVQSTVDMNPIYINLTFHDNGTDALFANSGTLTHNVTLDGSPAALNGAPILMWSTTVNPGKTLTITPGSVIKMAQATGILVYGALNANGTSGNTIQFISQAGSPVAGDWVGLQVWNGSTVHMDYVDLAYAGRDGNRAIYVQTGSDFQINHSHIHHNQGYGVVLEGSGLTGQLQNLEMDHNTQYPVVQSTVDMNPIYINLTFHDNGTDALFANGGTLTRNVTLDGSPTALNGAPIYLYTSLTVPSPFVLTVTPGSTIMVGANQMIWVQNGGTLNAEGTTGQRILFTHQTIAPPTSGWDRIRADTSARIRLAYCEISYAGSPNHRAVDTSSSDFQMSQCRIHHTNGSGFFANAGAAQIRNIVFSDNDQAGLWLVTTAQLSAYHTTITRNGIGILMDNSSSATLTNTILAANAIGVQVIELTCIPTLHNTLWDNNTTPLIGTMNETGHFSGPAMLDVDGYHIGKGSTAVNRGLMTEVTIDIDGESRPQPANTPPDLGADEVENFILVLLPLVTR